MHWKILKHYNIKANDKWYEHQPETVTENEKVTILWDMQVHTDKTIKANKPDIIIKDKQEKTCMLIDMAIPSDRNTSVKVAEKLSKYKDLEIEITKMWGLKTITVPVVIGALGVVKKGIEKHIDKIPGKINITELQKIALLGSSHILRKVLSIEWRPWLPIGAPDPGLDPALMVNMIEESRRIRDNNNNNNDKRVIPVAGYIMNVCHLGKGNHRYREVTGSNPVEVMNFSGFYTQVHKLRS